RADLQEVGGASVRFAPGRVDQVTRPRPRGTWDCPALPLGQNFMAPVAANQIREKIGEVAAVNGSNREAGHGQFQALPRASGCGKTRLLRIIAGLEKPTSGQVLIDGEVVNDMPPRARGVAMVFQSYGLYPHLTVWNNIAFPLRTQGTARDEIKRKVEWAAGL